MHKLQSVGYELELHSVIVMIVSFPTSKECDINGRFWYGRNARLTSDLPSRNQYVMFQTEVFELEQALFRHLHVCKYRTASITTCGR